MTLRELFTMAEANAREKWGHTSTMLAMIANVNRDPKKARAFKPRDFDPYAIQDAKQVLSGPQGLAGMRAMFEGMKDKR